ncbi:MAG: hypothetical protein KAQ92_02305, partial [Candidatus Aenigmarchaeota archaeon]|nr:hypothetical protein [Candidatus Aenigmarchaeota archaeon]
DYDVKDTIQINITIEDTGQNNDYSTFKWEMLNSSHDTIIALNLFDSNDSNIYWYDNIATASYMDGVYYIRIEANDTQDNKKIKNQTIYIDNTPPEVEINNPVEGSTYAGNITVNVSINDVAGNDNSSTYMFEMKNSTADIVLQDDLNNAGDNYFNYTIDTIAWNYPEGNYTIHIFANDTLNNTNNTQNVAIDIDNNPPEVDIATANNTIIWGLTDNAVINVTINDTANHGNYSGYKYILENASGIAESGTFDNSSLTAWHKYLNTNDFADGNYTFRINASDIVDNVNDTESILVVIDNTAPAINITSPLNNSYAKDTIYINATIKDTTVGIEISNATIGGNNITAWTYTGNLNNRSYSSTYDTTAWIEENKTITVFAIDFASNEKSESINIIVDNQNPRVTIASPSDNQVISRTTAFNVTINDTNADASTHKYLLENATWNSGWISLEGSGTDWYKSITTNNYKDGNYTFSINASDYLVQYNDTQNISVQIDNTAPNIIFNYPPDSQ